MLCCPVMLAAQNGVTVSGLVVNAGTVTFNVSWETPMPVEPWSDSVWVFVDYNNEGKMERLPLLPGATLTYSSWDEAYVDEIAGNDQGVWVVGNAKDPDNASGSFSATVQLFTDVANIAGACAYASNYPPVGKYTSVNTVKFTGTPPYYLTYSEGGAATVTREQAEGDYSLSNPLASFTDATGAPGVVSCKMPAVQTLSASGSSYCAGSGVTLALDGTEIGVTYQLYENTVPQTGATLTGTDAAATFTGLFGAGVYSVQTVSDAYCPAAMNGTITITEQALPDKPTAPDAWRCGAGSVTLYAESANANIYWFTNLQSSYDITGLSPSNTYTVEYIWGNSKMYAVAVDAASGCASSSPTSVLMTVIPYTTVGNPVDPRCGCAAPYIDCSGTCSYPTADQYYGGEVHGINCYDCKVSRCDTKYTCTKTHSLINDPSVTEELGSTSTHDWCTYFCCVAAKKYYHWDSTTSKCYCSK